MLRFTILLILFLTCFKIPALARDTLRAVLPDGRRIIILPDQTWQYEQDYRKVEAENGRELLIFDDRTWQYANIRMTDTIPQFSFPADTDTLMESEWGNYGIKLNSKKWSIDPNGRNPARNIDFKLEYIDNNAFGLVVFESKEISLDELQKRSLANFRKAAPDAKFVHKEMRAVNGKPLMFVKMELSMSSVPLIYYIYFYSGKIGTVQMSVFTKKSEEKNLRNDITELLNGFIVTK